MRGPAVKGWFPSGVGSRPARALDGGRDCSVGLAPRAGTEKEQQTLVDWLVKIVCASSDLVAWTLSGLCFCPVVVALSWGA